VTTAAEQIVRMLAELDPWDNEGNCKICGGEIRHVRDPAGYYYGTSIPSTHLSTCPWPLAVEHREIAYGESRQSTPPSSSTNT